MRFFLTEVSACRGAGSTLDSTLRHHADQEVDDDNHQANLIRRRLCPLREQRGAHHRRT